MNVTERNKYSQSKHDLVLGGETPVGEHSSKKFHVVGHQVYSHLMGSFGFKELKKLFQLSLQIFYSTEFLRPLRPGVSNL